MVGRDRDVLSQCDNLPLLNGSDLVELVRGAAGCPVAVENDARCFTLAGASGLYEPVLTARLQGCPARLATSELGRAAGVIGAAALNMD